MTKSLQPKSTEVTMRLTAKIIKSKLGLSNNCISINSNRWTILWNEKRNHLFSTKCQVTFKCDWQPGCSVKRTCTEIFVEWQLDFYLLQMWKSVLWRFFSFWLNVFVMKTFKIVFEHKLLTKWIVGSGKEIDTSFVKMRGVHAKIVCNKKRPVCRKCYQWMHNN